MEIVVEFDRFKKSSTKDSFYSAMFFSFSSELSFIYLNVHKCKIMVAMYVIQKKKNDNFIVLKTYLSKGIYVLAVHRPFYISLSKGSLVFLVSMKYLST